VDPVAGAYAIEKLTDEIEAAVGVLLAEVDRRGGALGAIESGFVQHAIQDAAYQDQRAVDAGERVVVGVNKHTTDGAPAIEVLRVDPDVERRQVERVRQVRASRDEACWRAALEQVRSAALEGGNLMPPIIAAVEAHATVGEISDTLRAVFGEYREVSAG
jgi:methylmalonyl-CoA mutase N-terminal domain/subunit